MENKRKEDSIIFFLFNVRMLSKRAVHIEIEDCEGWWLSGGRSSVAEHWHLKPGVLGLTPGGCRPSSFSLFSPHNI